MDKPIAVGQAVLDISKTSMYRFWYYYLKNQCIKTTLSCATWIQMVLSFIFKLMIFSKTQPIMQINGVILLNMTKMKIDHQKQEKTKKVIGKFNPIQDGDGGKIPPLPLTSFSTVTSTKERFGPQSFMTFSFNPFATLVQNFKFVSSANPKLLNLNQDHPLRKAIFLVKSL